MKFNLEGTLEQRAKENGRSIDMQWINENESNEMNFANSGIFNMPGGLDPDIQAMIENAKTSNNEDKEKLESAIQRGQKIYSKYSKKSMDEAEKILSSSSKSDELLKLLDEAMMEVDKINNESDDKIMNRSNRNC